MNSERAVTCDMVIEAVSASFDGEAIDVEARFIEAIRRSDRPGRPVTVAKALVRGKPGFRAKVGERTWTIEPQRN
ncbi:MAG: hypothetical protein ACO36F_10360, partial [Ilumatobacteraceae bacterium]